jgi:hypothetical protein
MDYARRMNKQLSPGEKSFYKIRYNVRKAKASELNEERNSKSDIIKNFIKTYTIDYGADTFDMEGEIDDIHNLQPLNKKDFVNKIKFGYRKAKESDIEDFYDSIKNESQVNEDYERTTYLSLEDAKFEAQQISDEEGVVQHVEETSEGSGEYRVSDFYDSDLTVASYENGMEL